MSKQSTTTMQVTVTGDGVNEQWTMPVLTNSAAPGGGPLAYTLASNDNTIPVPPGAVAMIVIPASSSAVMKKLKGIGGDTGFTISPNNPSMIGLPSPAPASVLLNAASGETVSILWL